MMAYVYKSLSTKYIAQALRDDQYAGWSYHGAFALAEHLETLAENSREPIELDIVALRCDYNEYESAAAACSMISSTPLESEFKDSEEYEEACLRWLQDRTTVLLFNGGIIIKDGEF